MIVDTTPLLAVADGAITAAAADGAILMVRHGRTSIDQLEKALTALDQVDARLLGTVLNYAPSKRRDGYGGYGYGYGYGYGHTKEKEKKRRFRRSSTPEPTAEAAPRENANH